MIRRALREALFIALLAAIPATVVGIRELQFQSKKPAAEGEISARDANALGDKTLWIDSRAEARFDRSHIPGALPLTPENWDAQIAKFLDAWQPEQTVVVYGEAGADSAATVALRLKQELQIPNVCVLQGGYEQWKP